MIAELYLPMGTLYVSGPENDKSCVPHLLANHCWEPHVEALLMGLVKPNDVVLEIGANLGQHTVLLSKLAKKVYAIEAGKNQFTHLQRTIEFNGCKNVVPYNIALGYRKGVLPFYSGDESTACGFVSDRWEPGVSSQGLDDFTKSQYASMSCEQIEVVPLDDLDFKDVTIVQMDVEGSELSILRGACNTLQHCPMLLLEMNALSHQLHWGTDIEALIYQILSLGYRNAYWFVAEKNRWEATTVEAMIEKGRLVSTGIIQVFETLFTPANMEIRGL